MPNIEGNNLTNNQAKSGSAIYGITSAPRIARNQIENNALYPLPGFYNGSSEGAINFILTDDVFQSDELLHGYALLIEANLIKGNKAAVGAGINLQSLKAGRIQNNLIIDNVAKGPLSSDGGMGGIYCSVALNGSLHILNNTIVGNTATYPPLPPFPAKEEGGGIAVVVFTNPAPPPPRASCLLPTTLLPLTPPASSRRRLEWSHQF